MANELADTIFASAVVEARVGRALIDVGETACVKVAARAAAFEPVHQVHADTSVGTRIALTLVDVGLTVLTHEPRHALTRVPERRTEITRVS